jgi:hypothetical protein
MSNKAQRIKNKLTLSIRQKNGRIGQIRLSDGTGDGLTLDDGSDDDGHF